MRKYLRSLRKKKAMTQQQLASQLDISLSYYCQIESGERQADMSLSIMKKLSEAFEVPLDYIVEQESKLNQAS